MNNLLNVIELNSLDRFRDDLLSDVEPLSIEEKLHWYLQFFGGINFKFGYNYPIIRARLCTSPKGFNNVSDMYHPPSGKTNIGRMNEKGEPMFYAAYHIGTAIAEINAKNGDILQVAQFELPKSAENGLRCLVIGEVFNSYHGISSISDSFFNEIRSLLDRLAKDNIRGMLSYIYMDALAAELLNSVAASESNYIYSRALSRLLLKKNPSIDGLIYPSAKIKGTSNIVLKPGAVFDKAKIISSQVIRVSKIFPYGICDYQVLKQAKGYSVNGDFIW